MSQWRNVIARITWLLLCVVFLMQQLSWVFCAWSVRRLYNENNTSSSVQKFHPCGGGVEYLHRDPTRHRRRRKGKFQIWDSNIWSRVPRDSDPRKTTLARASSIYKRQTRPLVREGAPEKQDRNCQRVINIWSWAPAKIYWLTDRQSQCDFDFDMSSVQFSAGHSHGKPVEGVWRLNVWTEDFVCVIITLILKWF
jgi:hypothetical protein